MSDSYVRAGFILNPSLEKRRFTPISIMTTCLRLRMPPCCCQRFDLSRLVLEFDLCRFPLVSGTEMLALSMNTSDLWPLLPSWFSFPGPLFTYWVTADQEHLTGAAFLLWFSYLVITVWPLSNLLKNLMLAHFLRLMHQLWGQNVHFVANAPPPTGRSLNKRDNIIRDHLEENVLFHRLTAKNVTWADLCM